MSRIIQVSELTYAARDRRRILENVFLSVERGKAVGIVGKTGSGKSLLVALLQGELRPQSGQILVNDRNVTRLSPAKLGQLRQHLGVLPQTPVWPEQLSVAEALQFKLSWLGLSAKQTARKIEETLTLLDMASLQNKRFPDLNLLERKIAYLASSLCHDPVLLLGDDPFSGLSEEGETTLALLLKKVRERRHLTTLLTGRRSAPLQRLGCRIVNLDNGNLEETV